MQEPVFGAEAMDSSPTRQSANGGEQGASRTRPRILEATEGEWHEKPPPDRQPQFRCIVHGPGSAMGRHLPDKPEPSTQQPQ